MSTRLFIGRGLFLFLYLLTSASLPARSTIDSLKNDLQLHPSGELQSCLTYELSLQYRDEALDSAEYYGQEALRLFQLAQEQDGIFHGHLNLGKIFFQNSRYQTGIRHFLEAWHMDTSFHLSEKPYSIPNFLAISYKHIGQKDSALYFFQEAMRLSELHNDSVGHARILVNLGSFFQDLKEAEQALIYLDKGIAYLQQLKSPLLLGMAYLNRGPVHFQGHDYELAVADFETALKIFEEKGAEDLALQTYGNLAIINIEKGNFAQAEQTLRRCLEAEQGKQEPNYRALTSYGAMLGSAYLKQQMGNMAIRWFRTSLNMNQYAADLSKEATLLEMLAMSFEQNQQYDSALRYYQAFDQLEDSLYNKKQLQKILDLQDKYEAEKKDQLIRLQQAEMKQTQLQLYLSWGIAGAFLFLAIGLVYLLSLRYNRVKLEAKLQRGQVLELLKDKENQWLSVLVEGQESERKRLGRELHDGLGSKLSAIRLQVNKYRHERSHLNIQLQETEQLIDQTINELREISHHLEGSSLQALGLQQSLTSLCNSMETQQGFRIFLDIHDLEQELNPQIEFNLYRIAQEALVNVAKYAEASQVFIILTQDEEGLSMIVEDDGVGFDVWKDQTSSGIGLSNMQARAQKIGGSLTIESQLNQGTSIIVQVPEEG